MNRYEKERKEQDKNIGIGNDTNRLDKRGKLS
jgi:hypothetical protein